MSARKRGWRHGGGSLRLQRNNSVKIGGIDDKTAVAQPEKLAAYHRVSAVRSRAAWNGVARDGEERCRLARSMSSSK